MSARSIARRSTACGRRPTCSPAIKASGEFRPELWQIARHEDDDVGCLLVNLHPDVKHAEIVYLAVVPEVRGRGWGLELTRHAQWLARQADVRASGSGRRCGQ